MKKLEFYIVDVFAEKKYAGNQLAVFRNSQGLSTEVMQAIARETNFSETTFINSDHLRDDGFDVRIFTPTAEIPFAGHPTLGTAFIIQKMILQESVARIHLNLKVGEIPVELRYKNDSLETRPEKPKSLTEGVSPRVSQHRVCSARTPSQKETLFPSAFPDLLWMKQMNPTFGKRLSPKDVAPILNLSIDELDVSFPIQEVSTGIPFFIVPVKTLQSVKKIKVNLEKYDEFVKRYNPNLDRTDADTVISAGFFVFCPETYEEEHDLNARMFDDYYGVPEDPATGSANGCFLAYLLKHQYFQKDELELRVEQGYEIKRPSLILIKGKIISENEMDIFVGGRAQLIAKGEWYV
ncbi:MAG: PhzF family phenazine biosynthesis protein [bacterium]